MNEKQRGHSGFKGTDTTFYQTETFEEKRALALISNSTMNNGLMSFFNYYVDIVPYKGRVKYEIIDKVTDQEFQAIMAWAKMKKAIIKQRYLKKKYE